MLLVPTLQRNLLSISQLISELPYRIEFNDKEILICHRLTGQLAAQGEKRDNIYFLKFARNVALFSSRQKSTSVSTWHCRLGHCFGQTLELLRTKNLIFVDDKTSYPSMCEACQLGKARRLHFAASTSNSLEPFDLLHCDLSGPSPVASWNNY